MINKRGETRPMVDLTGKFYLLNELDENFVKEYVDVEKYKGISRCMGEKRLQSCVYDRRKI